MIRIVGCLSAPVCFAAATGGNLAVDERKTPCANEIDEGCVCEAANERTLAYGERGTLRQLRWFRIFTATPCSPSPRPGEIAKGRKTKTLPKVEALRPTIWNLSDIWPQAQGDNQVQNA
jgi:hypothetical protein